MSFPSSPSNNQTAIVNGITYVYNASKTVWTRQQTAITASSGLDDYARTTANTTTNNITILQGVNVTQNTRLSVVEGGLISANANTVHLNSLITTNNTRISVIEGGLISANANTVYLNTLITTNNTRISSVNTTSSAAYAKANTNISSDLTLTVTNSGSGAYVIGGASNPTLTLYRGVTYYFSISASGHPFFIQTVSGGYSSGNLYTSGVTGAGTQVGTVTFTVPLDAPSNLYYVCQFHSSMNGAFLIENLISTVNTQNTRITIAEGVDVTQNTRIAILEGVNTTQNTNITTVTGLAQAAFDKANTGVTTSIDDYARTTANTATNNITILQGVNTTQNTNITYATNLAQAAYNQANTGGSSGLSSNTGIITVDTFIGNGSNVAFTLSVTPITKNYTSITIEGTSQLKDSYSLSGNIITFTEAPLNGDNVEVVSFTSGLIESQDNVARIIANTATSNITILQGVNTTQNTRITSADNTATAAYAKANAAFDKANTGVSTSIDTYARTTSNTATNNIVILQGVNATQNTNIAYATSLAQAAIDASANTGNYSIEYLVVAGGGGGGATGSGNNGAGGGGAGGLLTDSVTLSSGETYVITVGSGGNGGASGAPNNGNRGANSSLIGTTTTITAFGGGYGNASNDIGGPGGSGGGSKNGNAGGLGTAGQGNNGGVGSASGNCGGGGGGGAGAVGGNGSASVGGAGGVGLPSSITGSSLYYAGGGGGGTYTGNSPGAGGNGGGGAGAQDTSATSGTTNTGGGGGGTGGNSPGAGGNGGSGVVILRTIALADSTTGSPTITYDGAFNIYKFTSSGSIVFPSFSAEVVDITARADVVTLQSVNTTQNTRISSTDNTATAAYAKANAAFDKANTGVSTSTDDYARTAANTATNNITILQGVNTTQNTRMSVIEGGLITANANSAYLTSINTTQNTNITFATSLAQAAYNQANTGGLVSNTGIITVDTFTGDGSTVAFTLSVTPVTKNYTSITIDGATQLKSAYSLSGNIVTLSGAPLTGENIEVISFTNGVITSYDTVARDIANTATNNITILQGVNTTQNTRITSADNTATAAYAKANAAFDKANTGVTSSIDDYARTTSNTATNNITIIQGVNATQNANITYVISLAQAAYNQANTGGSSNVTIATSDSFVGNGSNVAYILSVTPSSKNYTFVNFDGTVQLRSSYSLSGNTITFTEAPLAGESIEVTSFSANSSLSGTSSGTTIGKAIAMSIIFGG